MKKELIDPRRVRSIPPEGFSWIDRRFVREGFTDSLRPEAILLYFLLVAVSDAQGLSFYADPTIARILKLDAEELSQARAQLVDQKLILYQYPLYQVLPLPAKKTEKPAFSSSAGGGRGGEPLSLGEVLRLALANTADPESARCPSKEKP